MTNFVIISTNFVIIITKFSKSNRLMVSLSGRIGYSVLHKYFLFDVNRKAFSICLFMKTAIKLNLRKKYLE